MTSEVMMFDMFEVGRILEGGIVVEESRAPLVQVRVGLTDTGLEVAFEVILIWKCGG